MPYANIISRIHQKSTVKETPQAFQEFKEKEASAILIIKI